MRQILNIRDTFVLLSLVAILAGFFYLTLPYHLPLDEEPEHLGFPNQELYMPPDQREGFLLGQAEIPAGLTEAILAKIGKSWLETTRDDAYIVLGKTKAEFVAFKFSKSDSNNLETDEIHLFKVETDGKRWNLHFLEKFVENNSAEIIRPTGMDLHGDDTPHLVINFASGENGYEGYWKRTIKLGVRPVVVDWALSKRIVLVTRPRFGVPHILIASDDSWASFSSCWQCGLFIPVIYAWTGTRYAPACRSFPQLIRPTVLLSSSADIADEHPPSAYFEVVIQEALEFAQLGMPNEAEWRYRQGLARFRQAIDKYRQAGDLEMALENERIMQGARKTFDHVFAEAKVHRDAPCPLLRIRSKAEVRPEF